MESMEESQAHQCENQTKALTNDHLNCIISIEKENVDHNSYRAWDYRGRDLIPNAINLGAIKCLEYLFSKYPITDYDDCIIFEKLGKIVTLRMFETLKRENVRKLCFSDDFRDGLYEQGNFDCIEYIIKNSIMVADNNMFKKIIKFGFNVNNSQNSEIHTEGLLKLLKKNYFILNDDEDLLLVVVNHNNYKLLEYFLKIKFPKKTPDLCNLALTKNYYECAKLLINNGYKIGTHTPIDSDDIPEYLVSGVDYEMDNDSDADNELTMVPLAAILSHDNFWECFKLVYESVNDRDDYFFDFDQYALNFARGGNVEMVKWLCKVEKIEVLAQQFLKKFTNGNSLEGVLWVVENYSCENLLTQKNVIDEFASNNNFEAVKKLMYTYNLPLTGKLIKEILRADNITFLEELFLKIESMNNLKEFNDFTKLIDSNIHISETLKCLKFLHSKNINVFTNRLIAYAFEWGKTNYIYWMFDVQKNELKVENGRNYVEYVKNSRFIKMEDIIEILKFLFHFEFKDGVI